MNAYDLAVRRYSELGIDPGLAIETLKGISISMQCWQGDDVRGFENSAALSGGIQATGAYPGRAGNFDELTADIDMAFSLIPGRHKLNLHACYAVFDGNYADRDKLRPEHFAKWASFARERGIGLDFNPTFFSHPLAADNLTLTSPNPEIRSFWVEHGKACLAISEYLTEMTGVPCTMNIWIPDGYKDLPADRMAPRARFKDSLDRILAAGYDKSKVTVCLESKVFGIGLESYTAGSAEFCINYAARNGLVCLMDSGHYHPTETVSDKISSMLLFHDKIALHVSRPVRWDSDHVVRFDDETREIAAELVRCDALNRTLLALDFFDASINRVAAWVCGMRNLQKALLFALLTPHVKLAEYQNRGDFTALLALQEELKLYPFGDVWNYYCELCGVPSSLDWLSKVREYEEHVQSKRR